MRSARALLAGVVLGTLAACSNSVGDVSTTATLPATPATTVATTVTTAILVETTASGSDGYESG